MIIGINGKIGSGKDTVGSIIQYLTFCKHYNRTDLSYEDFTNSIGWLPTWEIKKFAGKLKQIGSILSGVLVEMFEDQEFKKLNMNPEWGMTYREFLQKLGTEAMRDGLHTNVWVNALFADYKHSKTCNCKKGCRCAHDLPNWIITDMRFPNEMEAVELREGVTIKVVRPGTAVGTHPSETALDDAYFDHVISNDGTIEDLVEKVRQVLTIERII